MIIPIEVVSGIILINVSVNGINGYMAFDTGAMKTCLNKFHFPDFVGKDIEVAKFDNEMKTASAVESICDIRCHEWVAPKTSVLLLDMDYVEKPLRNIKPDLCFLGTIGIDLIREHTVLLDYANLQIGLDEDAPEGLEYFEMKTGVLPVIDVNVLDNVYQFVLDTGANTCLLDKSFGIDSLKVIDEVNGIVQIKVTALGSEYSDVTAVMHNIDDIKLKVPVSGVIGYQVLKNRLSFFDFKNEKIGIKFHKKQEECDIMK